MSRIKVSSMRRPHGEETGKGKKTEKPPERSWGICCSGAGPDVTGVAGGHVTSLAVRGVREGATSGVLRLLSPQAIFAGSVPRGASGAELLPEHGTKATLVAVNRGQEGPRLGWWWGRCRWLYRARVHCMVQNVRRGESSQMRWMVNLQRITSSAWKRRVGGIVRPRDWAVLRLMTSSNFMGCSTGSSEGLAPLRNFLRYGESSS